MRTQPGFARIAHAFSGLTYLAGEPGGPPVVPGSTSLADYMSGMYGAIGALVALKARDATGVGQCVDLALYESVFRVLDEIAPAYQKFGYVRERMGADTVNVCPHSHYPTRDGKWVAIACTSDQMFVRLADTMQQPELASAERYGPQALRLAARDDVNAIVATWVASSDCETILARCMAGGVPASLIYSIADIFEDPQYRARGNIKLDKFAHRSDRRSRCGPETFGDARRNPLAWRRTGRAERGNFWRPSRIERRRSQEIARSRGDLANAKRWLGPGPSCPDLTRASINLHNGLFRRKWITASSPVMTISMGMTAFCPSASTRLDLLAWVELFAKPIIPCEV